MHDPATPQDTTLQRVYYGDSLSIGLILPVRRNDEPVDFAEQIAVAELADQLGLAAIWVRDVPLNGPWYPEAIGHLDPWVALGAIASRTNEIAVGTAAAVLPLRHPLHLAKAAASLQALSGGRMLLGLGSGDRVEEYAAFDKSYEERKQLYRSGWQRVASALVKPSEIHVGDTSFEMRPAATPPPPLVAIGGGGQSLDWIARNATGWATYHREPATQRDRHALWRNAVDRSAPAQLRSFSVAIHIELDGTVVDPVPIKLGYRTGSEGLATIFAEQRALGVHHLMVNLTAPSLRPLDAVRLITETDRY